MKKTLSYLSFLFVFVFLLFLNACRTNEIVENEITQNEKIGAFVRFEEKMKTSKNASQNYNQPFAEIIGNYLTNHPDYRNNFETTIGKIDLSMSSQSFGDDYKVVLFPIRNTSNIVTDILVAQVNEDRDFVQFRLLLDDDFKSDAITDFNAKNGNKTGVPTYGTKDIETVQIKPPKKNNTISIPVSYFIYPTHDLPEEMDGGSPKHGGGGGGNTVTKTENSDCQNAKKIINNPKFINKYKELNTPQNLNSTHEKGIFERAYPSNDGTQSSYVSISNQPCSTHLDLPDDTSGIFGLFHIHNNINCDSNINVKAPSPKDIKTFFHTLMKQANIYKGSYSEAYSVVITSYGSYMINYNSSNWPSNVKGDNYEEWTKWYYREFQKLENADNTSEENVQNLFAQFINEVVSVGGLNVFLITENTATKLEYNSTTKKAIKNPCPNITS